MFNVFGYGFVKIKPRLDPPDPVEFFDELAASRTPDTYSEQERHRDFVHVFMQTPVGKIVLYQILEWGGMFASAPLDATAIQRHAGGRDLCLAIMTAIKAEVPREETPPPKPEIQPQQEAEVERDG